MTQASRPDQARFDRFVAPLTNPNAIAVLDAETAKGHTIMSVIERGLLLIGEAED